MKAIIFDIDGTLIESMAIDTELYFASIQAVLGPVRTRKELDDYDHVTDSGILTQIFEDNGYPVDEESFSAIRSSFVASLRRHIETTGPFEPIDGAIEFLEATREAADKRIAIATGGWRQSAILKLTSAGFDIEGIPLVTSDDSPSRVEIMRTALRAIGSEFELISYFGDAEWDRRACNALGWRFLAGITSYSGIEL